MEKSGEKGLRGDPTGFSLDGSCGGICPVIGQRFLPFAQFLDRIPPGSPEDGVPDRGPTRNEARLLSTPIPGKTFLQGRTKNLLGWHQTVWGMSSL